MDKFRREISIEVMVGLFIFVVLIALGIFTIVLSREGFLKKSYDYTVLFDEIGGLREGDNVYLRGMNVGRVKQTSLNDGDVSVYIRLDAPVHLRKGYKIEVVNSSMLGGKYLKIDEGPVGAPELPKGAMLQGIPPIEIIDELSVAVGGIQTMIASVESGNGTIARLLKDDSIYNNLLSLSDNLQRLGDRLDKGEGTLGKLIKEEELYDDVHFLAANLRKISDQLMAGEGTMGKLLQDEAVYDDAHLLVANLREVSARLADGEGTLGKLLTDDPTLYNDLQASMVSIRGITETVNSGEGTLGKLIKDPKLHDEAALLFEDMRAAIDDLRESSPISSFSSVVFGAF